MGNKRRVNGDAKAFPRKDDGLWVAFLELEPRWVDGKRKRNRKPFYGKTEQAAIDARKDAEKKLARGVLNVGDVPTLAYFLTEVFMPHVEDRLRPGTARNYRHRVEYMLVPALGHHTMDKITPPMLERALRTWKDQGYDGHTCRGARAVLSAAYTYARDALKGARLDSPIRKSNAVKIDAREAYILNEQDPNEADRFIAACLKVPYGVAFLMEALIGPRGGEVWGLTRADVLESEGKIRFQSQAQYVPVKDGRTYSTGRVVKHELERVPLKTEASKDKVDAPKLIFDVLKTIHQKDVAKRKLRAGRRWVEHDYLFPNTTGGLLSSSWATREIFHKICDLAKIPYSTATSYGLRPHDLRHSAVSLMLAEGVRLETISGILRHSRYATTMDMYGSKVEKVHRDAAQTMNARYGPKPKSA